MSKRKSRIRRLVVGASSVSALAMMACGSEPSTGKELAVRQSLHATDCTLNDCGGPVPDPQCNNSGDPCTTNVAISGNVYACNATCQEAPDNSGNLGCYVDENAVPNGCSLLGPLTNN
jgi:hypothetical protein